MKHSRLQSSLEREGFTLRFKTFFIIVIWDMFFENRIEYLNNEIEKGKSLKFAIEDTYFYFKNKRITA